MGSLQDLPSSHFTPSFLSSVNSWHGHLPFAYDLVALQRPSLIVELGVHFGDSYFTFCQAVSEQNIKCKCFGIDTWKGDHQCGEYGDEIWDKVRNYNNSNYEDFSSLIRNSFADAVTQFKDSSIDVLHIDGLHTYEAVKEDFTTWLPKVKKGGIVLLHDIEERKDGFGVHKFWEEIETSFPSFSFTHGHGLGVLINQSKVNQSKGQKVDWYLEQFEKFDLGKEYYQKLGSLITDRGRSPNCHDKIDNPYGLIHALNDGLHELENQKEELENELNASIQKFIVMEDKVRRMSSSLSWRITVPLRFLRRKLVDPVIKKISTKSKRRKLNYNQWVMEFDTLTQSRINQYKSAKGDLSKFPKLSIILPVFNISPNILKETIKSVEEQIYDNWELIIVDDCSDSTELKDYFLKNKKTDPRLNVFQNKKNLGISATSNIAISNATGEYLLFLDHDDLLRQHSLLRFAQVLVEKPSVKLVYSDEDKINNRGKRMDPHFKPDWNPDLLLSQNYICHLCCLSTNLVREIGGFRSEYEGCQDWDLILRATEKLTPVEIYHIPEILYHWRKSPSSTSTALKSKPYIFENSLKTIESAIDRRGIIGNVMPEIGKNNYVRIKYSLPKVKPLVSVIIPIRDRVELLKKCLDGLDTCNNYENYEVLIIDNGSTERSTLSFLDKLKNDKKFRIISIHGPFNYSKINNQAVKHAKGDLLLFLNNDVYPIHDCWLEEMVSHALRREVGCVGAKLLYEDNTIQHAGVILGIWGIAGHCFRRYPKTQPGYMTRLQLVQNYSAVTAACLLVKKDIFVSVSGFDEENLKVAFNDVDLCLKIKELGYWNVWTPHALLYHRESASRGSDLSGKNLNRYNREVSYLRNKWPKFISHDPGYNPNLTKESEDFSLRDISFESNHQKYG